MAEFCLKCFNKIHDTNIDERTYILSDYLDLCEECGEWKRIVVCPRNKYFSCRFGFFILLFKIFSRLLSVLWRFLCIPYTIYRSRKNKNSASD